jgi:hypothetical protein
MNVQAERLRQLERLGLLLPLLRIYRNDVPHKVNTWMRVAATVTWAARRE